MKSTNKKYISLDKFIENALYKKNSGFYMNKNPIGKNGDFITSPNISILFSEMIAVWVISFWEHLKYPKKINLVEMGGGTGEMTFQLLKTFDNFPKFKNSCKTYIFEKSPFLIKLQKKKLKKFKIKWLKKLKNVDKCPTIYLANEFFDSLSIKQFYKKKNSWFEKYVKIQNSKYQYYNVRSDIKKLENKIGIKISKKQRFIEFSPLQFKYLREISEIINLYNGGLLLIDYGYKKNLMKDTIQSVYKHRKNELFNNVGKSDITHHVSFNLISKFAKKFQLKCSNVITQSDFLINLGILKRAEIISRNLPFTKKANIYFRLKRLIDKNQMGRLFKVIFLANTHSFFNRGFKTD
tara:strand:- start:1730 stop:2782 length:1053 start_codon:yes stop_codon:yes gene_type:complete